MHDLTGDSCYKESYSIGGVFEKAAGHSIEDTMEALRDVHSEYRQTIEALRVVPLLTDLPCLVALRNILPAFFHRQIAASGRPHQDYRCFGSYCENDRAFAKVPWVACCHRDLAPAESGGFCIALLFREDMAGCWLSLNSGYAHYRQAIKADQAAQCPPIASTHVLSRLIAVPERFTIGPIDLAATTDFGRSYEAGAGVSRFYGAAQLPCEDELVKDFHDLLALYDRLAQQVATAGQS